MSENLTMSELMDSFELKHFHKGEIVKGKVISVKNDEIIVNIGHFADGVVPRNEISNDKNFDINSINVDDDIFVMVLSGDDGEGNVLLSKKRADAIKVWDDLKEAFEKEKSIKVSLKEVVKGGIVGDFNGLRVFMPASQCAGRRIENLEELVGKTLEVRVIEFNKENRKVVVSRRIIDEEIRNINKDYENIILNIPSPILVRSAEGGIKKNKVISINKKYEKSFKCVSSDLVDMTLEQYFETFNIDFFDNREFKRLNLTQEKKAEIVSYNDTANCIVNFVMSDSEGEEHVEEVRVGDYWSDNKLFKLLTFRDITKEINILRTVNEQKIIYEKLLDVIPEAIFLEDLSTSRVLYTNRAFRELFGISSDVLGVTTQKYRNILVKKYINNLNIGEREKSIHIVNENNHIKEVKMISRTLYFGQKRSRVRIIKDLSVQRESERLKKALIKQRQYDQMKMEFYANISHELKTPLNNIYSSVQLIENLYKKGKIIDFQDILKEHIKITKQNMFRLLRLIDNIINISQVKSDIYKIKAVNFDIIDITERIVTSISSYAKSKGIDLIFDTDEETVMVGLDPESIERIILNILSNAIKFTLEGGEILVGIYKKDETVEIIIKDTGVGIDKEKLNDIFNRFKQIENSGISNEFGSGIGLCLTKSLIEIQNGKIYIDSKVGEGTNVKVIFPIKEVVEEVYDNSNYNDNIEKFEIEFFDIYK